MSIKANIIATIERTAAKTEASRERRKLKGNATSYMTIWNDAVSSKASDGVAPTQKALAMLQRAMSRLASADAKRKRDFLEWSVDNWVVIGQGFYSGKSGLYPVEPDLSFFVANVSRFYTAYCAKDKPSVLSKLSSSEVQILRNRITVLEQQVSELAALNKELSAENVRLKSDKRKRTPTGKGLSAWD